MPPSTPTSPPPSPATPPASGPSPAPATPTPAAPVARRSYGRYAAVGLAMLTAFGLYRGMTDKSETPPAPIETAKAHEPEKPVLIKKEEPPPAPVLDTAKIASEFQGLRSALGLRGAEPANEAKLIDTDKLKVSAAAVNGFFLILASGPDAEGARFTLVRDISAKEAKGSLKAGPLPYPLTSVRPNARVNSFKIDAKNNAPLFTVSSPSPSTTIGVPHRLQIEKDGKVLHNITLDKPALEVYFQIYSRASRPFFAEKEITDRELAAGARAMAAERSARETAERRANEARIRGVPEGYDDGYSYGGYDPNCTYDRARDVCQPVPGGRQTLVPIIPGGIVPAPQYPNGGYGYGPYYEYEEPVVIYGPRHEGPRHHHHHRPAEARRPAGPPPHAAPPPAHEKPARPDAAKRKPPEARPAR